MASSSETSSPRPPQQPATIAPGVRVRVTQQITARHYAFITPVEGTVVSIARRPTGSWFTHGAANKLWLDRIVLRKADGEITTLNLDDYSFVEVLSEPAQTGQPSGPSGPSA